MVEDRTDVLVFAISRIRNKSTAMDCAAITNLYKSNDFSSIIVTYIIFN